jgi:hypothetical protein
MTGNPVNVPVSGCPSPVRSDNFREDDSMKIISFSGAIAALAFVTLMAVSAGAQVLNQPTQAVANPLSVKVGAFWPSSGTASHSGGKNQISAGLDYAVSKTSSSNPSLPSVYFDYEGGTANSGHLDTYGLGVAIRSYSNTPGAVKSSTGSPYVGAGIGAYDQSGKQDNKNSVSKINLGGKVFVGDEFTGGFFVEANYQILSSIAGMNPSGVGLQVGMRF